MRKVESGMAAIKSIYNQEMSAIEEVARATARELIAKQAFDQAYSEGMLDEENNGSNQQKRDAYACLSAWKQRVRLDAAREEKVKCIAELDMIRTQVKRMEMLRDVFKYNIDPEEMF